MKNIIENLETSINLIKKSKFIPVVNREEAIQSITDPLKIIKSICYSESKTYNPSYSTTCSIIHYFTMIVHGKTNGLSNFKHDLFYYKFLTHIENRLIMFYNRELIKQNASIKKKAQEKRLRNLRIEQQRESIHLVN